eukprot:1149102-Pelagomonas_calceolata.AAC.1
MHSRNIPFICAPELGCWAQQSRYRHVKQRVQLRQVVLQAGSVLSKLRGCQVKMQTHASQAVLQAGSVLSKLRGCQVTRPTHASQAVPQARSARLKSWPSGGILVLAC